MEQTTIQINKNVKSLLLKQKISDKDSYNDILERILEDTMEFTEKTKRDIAESKRQIARGEVVSLEEIEKELGL